MANMEMEGGLMGSEMMSQLGKHGDGRKPPGRDDAVNGVNGHECRLGGANGQYGDGRRADGVRDDESAWKHGDEHEVRMHPSGLNIMTLCKFVTINNQYGDGRRADGVRDDESAW